MKFTSIEERLSLEAWRRYVIAFIVIFVGTLAAAHIFIVLVDPFGVSPIRLPLKRALVTVQRYMYPQVIRSHQFDSVIVGTSTSMLLDPEILNTPLRARFANVAIAAATAWEQKTLVELFLREMRHPKAIVIGLDAAWCTSDAERSRVITFRGFPDWLYDDNRWNDYLHLLNRIAFMSAVRLVRFNLGLYSPTMRSDGMDPFLPPDSEYDLQQARKHIYGGLARDPARGSQTSPAFQGGEQEHTETPLLPWLDEILSRLPNDTLKVLAFMPVHIPRESKDRLFDICKTRAVEIGRRWGATVIDWRIFSAITSEDSNYWDPLHYRVPVANRIAHDLTRAVLSGEESGDGTYRLLHIR